MTMRRFLTMILAITATALVAVGVAAAAAETASPPSAGRREAQATIAASPSTAAPGSTVTVSGNAAPAPGECSDGVTITSTSALFPPDGFGPVAPMATDGDFETTVTVPADTPPGSYQIGARCGGANVGIGATLEVTPSAALAATPVESEPDYRG
jgi:hypothetical protein